MIIRCILIAGSQEAAQGWVPEEGDDGEGGIEDGGVRGVVGGGGGGNSNGWSVHEMNIQLFDASHTCRPENRGGIQTYQEKGYFLGKLSKTF